MQWAGMRKTKDKVKELRSDPATGTSYRFQHTNWLCPCLVRLLLAPICLRSRCFRLHAALCGWGFEAASSAESSQRRSLMTFFGTRSLITKGCEDTVPSHPFHCSVFVTQLRRFGSTYIP